MRATTTSAFADFFSCTCTDPRSFHDLVDPAALPGRDPAEQHAPAVGANAFEQTSASAVSITYVRMRMLLCEGAGS
ncbi:MAG TPA: hypothetical protein VHH91_10070 [Vicinamibacterales bacterium]|nr:hypothetical protein [Vicinamibacterales bacterium]